MKRPLTIAALTLSLLAVLAACGGQSTPTATPSPAQPTAHELKQAGQQLFDTFSTAIQTQDAAALHGIFVADLRGRCTVEQMQEALGSGGVSFPEAEVKAVFLDLEDPTSAFMQLALSGQPEGNFEAVVSGMAFAFPFPMMLEEGGWRLSFPTLAIVQEEGCPFSGGSTQAEARPEGRRIVEPTPQPALPRLAPPPGARAIVSGGGGGSGEYTASVLLKTDMTLVALLEHYRQQIIQPEWKVQQETIDEGLAALTWTLRDEADYPWFGVLLIIPAEDGQWWVRMWSGSGAGGLNKMVFQGRETRVPAPTNPN